PATRPLRQDARRPGIRRRHIERKLLGPGCRAALPGEGVRRVATERDADHSGDLSCLIHSRIGSRRFSAQTTITSPVNGLRTKRTPPETFAQFASLAGRFLRWTSASATCN